MHGLVVVKCPTDQNLTAGSSPCMPVCNWGGRVSRPNCRRVPPLVGLYMRAFQSDKNSNRNAFLFFSFERQPELTADSSSLLLLVSSSQDTFLWGLFPRKKNISDGFSSLSCQLCLPLFTAKSLYGKLRNVFDLLCK